MAKRSSIGRRIRDHMRVAYEDGYRWALDVPTEDPSVPPDHDCVVMDLGERQREAADYLLPATFWQQWYAGWREGTRQRGVLA